MVQITSDHTICILDDDVLLGRRGCRKLRVHLLADNVIHSPFSTKTDIGTKGEVEIVVPHCHIMSQDFLDALVPTKESPPESGETVDISDDAYLPSHKRRELQEKKSKNRAKEIYRHEMYLLSLHQENESRKKDWSLTSLLGQSAPSTPTSAVETLSVSTTTAVTPAAISPYPNTPGGSESLRIGVFRGTELVSIDPEEWISIMAEKNIQSHFVAPPSIREVPEEPSEDDEELVNDETSISSAKERRPPKRARRSKTNSIE